MHPTALSASFLGRFNAGKASAIGQAFLRYEAELNGCVRRRMAGRLRGKFDAEDVVHSLWARLLPQFRACRWWFADVRQLRAFLVRGVNNRLANRLRRCHLELRCLHDQRAGQNGPAARQAEEEEAVQIEEAWQRVLACCPAPHQDVLHLKRQGWTLERIAALKGLHKGSVRRILYSTLHRLQEEELPPAP
jgi:RNA polymerase sigma factor (sigma-70 family)